jgi:hypothetical protein
MDNEWKKQLLEQYKNRKTENGVFALICLATQEEFLGRSPDIQTYWNSVRYKLSINYHPNKRLQALWKEYGEAGFEKKIMQLLDPDKLEEDPGIALEKLYEKCLADHPEAKRIWL